MPRFLNVIIKNFELMGHKARQHMQIKMVLSILKDTVFLKGATGRLKKKGILFLRGPQKQFSLPPDSLLITVQAKLLHPMIVLHLCVYAAIYSY